MRYVRRNEVDVVRVRFGGTEFSLVEKHLSRGAVLMIAEVLDVSDDELLAVAASADYYDVYICSENEFAKNKDLCSGILIGAENVVRFCEEHDIKDLQDWFEQQKVSANEE